MTDVALKEYLERRMEDVAPRTIPVGCLALTVGVIFAVYMSLLLTYERTEAEKRNPLQSHRRIDDMLEEELRTYARQLGITQRDATGLAIDRLRQNCKARLFDLIEDL